MRKFIIPLVTVAVVAILILGGCVPTRAPAPPAVEYPAEIPIGIVCALSGGWSGFGVKPGTGFEVAVEQVNENGGIKNLGGAKLKCVKGDDQAVPERAAAEAERLITLENVVAIIGIWPTDMPVSDVAERYETPGVFPLGIARVNERGYSYGCFHPYCTGADEAEQQMRCLITGCQENGIPYPKTCYIAGISDDCSVTNLAGMRDQCAKWGITIVGDEIVETGPSTYMPVITKMMAAKPDFITTCFYTGGAVTFYREIMENQVYFPYGIMSWGGGIEDIAFYQGVPPQAYAYAWSQENGDACMYKRPWFNYINDVVKDKIGTCWTDSHFVSPYCAVWQIKDALERVEWSPDLATFRRNLRDAIATTDITRENGERIPIPGTDQTFIPALDPLLMVRVTYDATGQNIYRIGCITQNINGTRWPMYPVEWREPDGPSKIVLPIPPWPERPSTPLSNLECK